MQYLSNSIKCFMSCITASESMHLMFFLVIGALILSVIFILTKKSSLIFSSQGVASALLVLGFASMRCSMASLIWIYLSIIICGIFTISLVQISFDRYVRKLETNNTNILSDLSREFKTDICLLNTQKIKAFVHKKRIYISVGILEQLEWDEIKAVIAHEVYHLRHSPNKLLATSLALTSFWFKRYSDEMKADKFAIEWVGRKHLENALQKLQIKKIGKRLRKIAP